MAAVEPGRRGDDKMWWWWSSWRKVGGPAAGNFAALDHCFNNDLLVKRGIERIFLLVRPGKILHVAPCCYYNFLRDPQVALYLSLGTHFQRRSILVRLD